MWKFLFCCKCEPACNKLNLIVLVAIYSWAITVPKIYALASVVLLFVLSRVFGSNVYSSCPHGWQKNNMGRNRQVPTQAYIYISLATRTYFIIKFTCLRPVIDSYWSHRLILRRQGAKTNVLNCSSSVLRYCLVLNSYTSHYTHPQS